MSGSVAVGNLNQLNRNNGFFKNSLDFIDNGNNKSPIQPHLPSSTTSSSSSSSSSSLLLDYRKYEDRLKSYVNWPNKEVPIESLAHAGFYYKNCNDIVRCPYCHIEGYQWVVGDDPMEDHRRWSPQCPFIMNSFESDGSAAAATDNNQQQQRNVDTCGLYGVQVLPNSVPEDEIHLQSLGIPKTKGPAHPDNLTYESRLHSFQSWPKSIKQKPKMLADAGFYYVGLGDQTICFQCGGGLKDWEENDDPWQQHALWFPKCSYLILKKGQDYINDVKEKKDPREFTLPPNNPQSSSSSSDDDDNEAKDDEIINNCTKKKTSESGSSSSSRKNINHNNEANNEKSLCKICYKNDVGVVFLPCRHIVACIECSLPLKTCAVCRKTVESTVRVFLS